MPNSDKSNEDIKQLKEQVAELTNAREQYRQLVEFSPEAVAIHAKGILLYVNKAALQMIGAKSASEVVGKSITQFVHPDFIELVKKRVKLLYETNKATPLIQEKFIRTDGTVIDVEVISRPINYDGQKAIQIAVRDITERKKFEEQLQIQAQIAESINDAVIVMDKNYTVISWNKGAEKLYGWKEKDVLGKKTMEVIPHVYLTSSAKEFHEQIKTGYWRGQVTQHTKKGKKLLILASASLVRDSKGETIGYVTINRDITEEIASSGRLAAIVESSDDAILSKSLDGIIQSWNKAAEKMFGYKAEEIIGKNITLIVPHELRAEEKEIIRKLKKGERIQHFETTRVGKSGNRIIVSLTISPIKNEKGEIVGASNITRDVTERIQTEQALKESEERLRLALEAGQIGVWDWNMVTNTLVWTDKVYAIHAVSKDTFNLTLENYLKLIHPEDREAFDRELKEATQNKAPFRFSLRILTKEGIKWITTSAIIFYDNKGKAVRMLGATSDITKQRQLDQEKSDFLSMASHELKTPLTSMKMFIDLLNRQLHEDISTNAKSFYFADRIKDQADRLAELTNDLLDVSRIETGKLRFNKETFQLAQLVVDTVESIQPSTSVHTIATEVKTDPKVTADRYRIYQVLVNLLTNAIKYSAKGKKINVSVDEIDGMARVSVQDFGIGIKKDQQHRIFERLYQVTDPEEKTFPGLGLGLYISKEIVDRHNGKIWVESQKGKGSTFFFTIPKNNE